MSLPSFLTTNTPGLASEQKDILNNNNAPGAPAAYSHEYQNRVVIAPVGVGQIGAFAFDYHGQDEVSMDNDVTDHWVESNLSVQDNIAIKPNMITLRGYVSELSLQASVFATLNAALATVETALSQAPAYLGKYSAGTTQTLSTAITQVQNVVVQIEQSLARVAQVAQFFSPGPSMNKQQAAFAQLSALRNARVLFTVFTPFQVFWNVAIVNLKAIQSEKTRTMSDFVVTMKQIQFTQNISPSQAASNNGGNSQFSVQAQTSNGITAGTPSPFSNIVSSFKSTARSPSSLL